jgi:hypothetical protein
MQPEVADFLEEVRTHLHLDPRTEKRVITELSTHFEEKLSDLYGQGMPEAEAARAALDSFGAPAGSPGSCTSRTAGAAGPRP